MKKTKFKINIIIFVILLISIIFCNCTYSPDNDNLNDAFTEAKIVRVIDGDTVLVKFLNGQTDRVRLIGINTPESVHPDKEKNSKEGKDASEFTQELLLSGTIVYLEKDVSDRDQYDRLLRYVWLEIPDDSSNLSEIETNMVNAILIKEGYAEAVTYEPDTKNAEAFEKIESNALQEKGTVDTVPF